MRTTRCWRSILSIRRVMLGLSLKVALHNSCCVTPSFSHKKMRTVHCSGVISKPFCLKLRDNLRLIAADTLPFRIANISRMSKLNCSIMKLLFKQLCKYSTTWIQYKISPLIFAVQNKMPTFAPAFNKQIIYLFN